MQQLAVKDTLGELDNCILAIDQGTTSSRAIVFAPDGTVITSAQQEFAQHFPENGWVDGSMVYNDWLCQFLADILNISIIRPKTMETTALGAAYLAGLQAGIYTSTAELHTINQIETEFTPTMESSLRAVLLKGWASSIQSTLAHKT